MAPKLIQTLTILLLVSSQHGTVLFTTKCFEPGEIVPNEAEELLKYSSCVYNATLDMMLMVGIEEDHVLEGIAELATRILSDILDKAETEGKKILEDQQQTIKIKGTFKNERKVTDFDENDEIDRNYFLEVHFPDDKLDTTIPRIDDPQQKNLTMYGKITAQAYRALENVLDTLGKLNKTTDLDDPRWKPDGVAIFTEVISSTNLTTMHHLTLKTHTRQDPRQDKEISVQISGDAGDVLKAMNISKVQIQVTEVLENPFFVDTSAIVQSPVVSIIVKDESVNGKHLPVILEGVDKPFHFWIPLHKSNSSTTAAGDLRGTERIQIDKPLKDLSPKDIKPFHLVLPYNTILKMEIVQPNSDMFFTVIYLQDVWPVISDFCGNKTNVTFLNTTSNMMTFSTPNMSYPYEDSSKNPIHYLDFYVAIYASTSNTYLPSTLPRADLKYRVEFTRPSCLYRNEDMDYWSEKGCVVNPDSTQDQLHCSCSHESIFAGTLFQVPDDLDTLNVLDFSATDFEKNFIVLSTVCVILALYIIGMIICCVCDWRGRKHQVGLTIMTNLECELDKSYYLISVITANRFGAGTTANVCIQLYGTWGRSQVYVLKESLSPTLHRGGIDTFLVSSERNLGKIERIRMWHDNTGTSPNWYCRKVIIRNVKSEEEWFFFVDKWLHVTGKESTIIFEKSLATQQEFNSFSRQFRKNLSDHIDYSHLWFSVICHPTASRFTRCQKLTCAFTILTAYLFLNIIVYGIELEDPDDPYGLKSYIVALQLALLEIPFGLLIITMFRRIRQRVVPTLIIWRNRPKEIPRHRRTSTFIPQKTSMIQVHEGGDVDSEHSSNISIPETDIEEFEAWVAASHGDVREQYVHLVKDHNITEQNRIAYGRMGLVHAVRAADPTSFVFSGEHNIPEWESLMDEEIKSYMLKSKTSLEDIRQKRNSTPKEPALNCCQHGFSTNCDQCGIALETCEMPPQKQAFCFLPWWFIIVPWLLCFIAIFVFLYFTLLYGLHYGYLRSLDWLLRILLSFLISVFIIEPLNILVFALLTTILCRVKNWSIFDEERFQILLRDDDKGTLKRTPLALKMFEAERSHPPLSNAEIFELKVAARRHTRFRNALAKLFLYSFALVPLLFLAYAGAHQDNFLLVKHMRNVLHVNSKLADIASHEDIYQYLQNVFIHAIHPDVHYNGKPKVWGRFENIHIVDFINVLIGVPRIRQLRVRPEKCHVPDAVKAQYPECFDYYSSSHQETGTFFPRWVPVRDQTLRRIPKSNDVWRFRSVRDKTFVSSRTITGSTGTSYDGGGYLAELGRGIPQSMGVIRYLKRTNWIDKQTRAVFVELTVFNPNMNMFLDVVILVEHEPSHSFETSFHITPVYLNTDDEADAFYYYFVRTSFICLLLVLVILIILLIWNIFAPSELHAHRRAWFWFDVLVIAFIIAAIAVSLKKHSAMLEAVEIIQLMKINEYISLQHLADWNRYQTAAFSITQMICFLKIWRLLVYLDGSFLTTSLTVSLAANLLLTYFFVIMIVLVAFACSGHIMFGRSMSEFSTFGRSLVTLVGQSLDVSLFTKLYTAEKIVGPLFASVFGFLVTFIFLNILIAILNQSMIHARMVAKEKYRTWGIAETVFHRIFYQPRSYAPAIVPDNFELQPHRLEMLKKATVQLFRAKLESEDSQQMSRMKACTKLLIEGSGYTVTRRKSPQYHQEVAKEARINQMRLHTAAFLRERIGADLSVEELQKYNDVYRAVVTRRIFRLEKQVRQLQALLDKY